MKKSHKYLFISGEKYAISISPISPIYKKTAITNTYVGEISSEKGDKGELALGDPSI
jgi:hypothetical protein